MRFSLVSLKYTLVKSVSFFFGASTTFSASSVGDLGFVGSSFFLVVDLVRRTNDIKCTKILDCTHAP